MHLLLLARDLNAGASTLGRFSPDRQCTDGPSRGSSTKMTAAAAEPIKAHVTNGWMSCANRHFSLPITAPTTTTQRSIAIATTCFRISKMPIRQRLSCRTVDHRTVSSNLLAIPGDHAAFSRQSQPRAQLISTASARKRPLASPNERTIDAKVSLLGFLYSAMFLSSLRINASC